MTWELAELTWFANGVERSSKNAATPVVVGCACLATRVGVAIISGAVVLGLGE